MSAKVGEENKRIIRDFFQAVDEGKLDIVKSMLTSEFLLHPASGKPWGAKELVESMTRFYAAFPGSRHVFDDFVAEGDKVVVRLHVVGRHKREYNGIPATDVEIKIAGMHMISIVGGKLKDWWAVEDHLGWYRQLGLELKPK